MKFGLQISAVLIALGLFTGCSTVSDLAKDPKGTWGRWNKKESEQKVAVDEWISGNYEGALDTATNEVARCDKDDELIWRLHEGVFYVTVDDYASSLAAWDRADELIFSYEEDAKIRTIDEAMALLTSQAGLPYEGHAYDKIVLSTYKALVCLGQSEEDKARVELQRCLFRQRNAVAENSRRIEKAQEAAEESKSGGKINEWIEKLGVSTEKTETGGKLKFNPFKKRDSEAVNSEETEVVQVAPGETADGVVSDGEEEVSRSYDVDRAKQDPKYAEAEKAELARLDKRMLGYGDYVNPFSVFVDGLFFSHLGLDGSDRERARKSFERVQSMSPGKYIEADYAMAEALCNGKMPEPVTYVLFLTGMAPSREESRLDIPMFAVTDEVDYLGAAFPKLVYHDNFIEQMTVANEAGESYVSEQLCSMDAVISQDFKNEWPVMVTKTMLTAVTKAYAYQAAGNAAGGWGQVAAVGAQYFTNKADLRTWDTLPKQFGYVRMATPEDGRVSVSVGMHQEAVSLEPGKVNVVLVRSINDQSVPLMQSFSL